jgi:hypothetical protein
MIGCESMKRATDASDTGIIDEDVQAMKGALDVVGQGFDGAQIGDIACRDRTSSGALLDVVDIAGDAVLNDGGGLFESLG